MIFFAEMRIKHVISMILVSSQDDKSTLNAELADPSSKSQLVEWCPMPHPTILFLRIILVPQQNLQ